MEPRQEIVSSPEASDGPPAVYLPLRDTTLPPGGKIPLRFQHVSELSVTLVSLEPGDIAHALQLAGIHPPDVRPLGKLPAPLRTRQRTFVIETDTLDPPDEHLFDPFAHVKADQVLVVLEAPGASSKAAVYQRGDVGVLAKLGTDSGLVWATETNTGKPVPKAQVSVYHGPQKTWSGVTDSDGLVRTPGRDQLRSSNTAGAPFILVRTGGHAYFTSTDWTSDLEPWMFGLPYYYYSGQQALRGMITAERGIYRPGEAVHLLGVLREREPGGRLVPPNGTARITVTDPDGTELVREAVSLTSFGTLQTEIKLPQPGVIGRHFVTLQKGDVTLYENFEVGEYRAATFEVRLPPAGPANVSAGEILLPVEASYLYDAPVEGAEVEYHISVRERAITFAGYEDYVFHRSETSSSYPRHVTSGALTLDEEGRGRIALPLTSLPLETDGAAPALDVLVEVTVQDAAHDAITARTVQQLERFEVVAGIRSSHWVLSPQSGWNVEVVALDALGQPSPGQSLEVELQRTYYNSIAERGPHGTRYRTSLEREVVAQRKVTSRAKPSQLHFDLPGGGTYELSVRRSGDPYLATQSVWAYGSEAVGPALNNARIELRLDQDSYEPGDRVKAYAAIPYAKSTALLTVERSGILHTKVLELGSDEAALELDVSEAYLPNAYVGLVVVPRGAPGKSPMGGYPLRAGYAELRVSPDERRLMVSIEPDGSRLEPGEKASVKVLVTDPAKRPVQAEVTLWAADEGVLLLTGYETPDPFRPVYAPYEIDVTTATNLARWTRYDPSLWMDGGGDGSGSAFSALRSRFLSTAHFSLPVVTDERGEARVEFTLPDNITRWRIMAVAADQGERFGHGESSLTTSKPLQVLPALPRFVTEGDRFDAGFVVHNHTGAAIQARLQVDVKGATLLGNSTVLVGVESGRTGHVNLPVKVGETGQVVVSAQVEAAGKRDGVRLAIPSHPATQRLSRVVSEGALSGRSTRRLNLPKDARLGSAELEVTVSTSVLSALAPAVQALLEYPYGCAEQKTSRLIPMAALGDLVRRLGVAGFDHETHRQRLAETIAELRKHQNPDGGFGLWVESDSDPFITAYVLFGWTVASEHGYSIVSASFEQGIRYLLAALEDGRLEEGYFGHDSRTLVAYVLARSGRADETLSKTLFDDRRELDVFDRALLAAALASRGAREDATSAQRATRLLGELMGSRGARSGLLAGGRASSPYAYGSDLRATAVLVHALITSGRTSEAQGYVRSLLSHRGKNGTWGTTYNNLWALLALSGYAEEEQSQARAGSVTVRLEGKEIAHLSVGKGELLRRIAVPLALEPGKSQALSLEASAGATLEHVVRFSHLPTPQGQPALAQGYRLERAIFDAKSGAPVIKARAGQLLRVQLTVETNAERHQVALTDRLPAGFEAVDARLATSQRMHQANSDWRWQSSDMRDERVSFFSYGLGKGSYKAEYLVLASRSGDFVWPAASVESMYQPDERARTPIARHVVMK